MVAFFRGNGKFPRKGIHHTKQKGDLGVLKAQVDLHQQGFQILNPLTEHAPFDLVIYKDNHFRRVQVKYKSVDKTGALSIRFSSFWSDKNGTHERFANKNEIDLYCIYCPETDECYYFDPKKYNRSINLRVRAAKNNQDKFVKLVSDFRGIP